MEPKIKIRHIIWALALRPALEQGGTKTEAARLLDLTASVTDGLPCPIRLSPVPVPSPTAPTHRLELAFPAQSGA